MSHPNETTLREAYAAFARGDLDGYLTYCTDGIVFHVPARNRMAGDYSRAQFHSPFIGKVMELSGGTFREVVVDVVANDRTGAVIADHSFERNGRTHAYRTVHLYRIVDGKLDDFRELPEDLHAFDAAWA